MPAGKVVSRYAIGTRKVPGKMNKVEKRYSEKLETDQDVYKWWYEIHTIKLEGGVRYTPDFLVQTEANSLEFHEIKGGVVTRVAINKFKAARVAAPWAKFRMFLWSRKRQEWIEETI